MGNREDKATRMLDIFVRLCEGKIVNKTEEALKYSVNERSIQRDIDDIRYYLEARNSEEPENRTVRYDRVKKGFVMDGISGSIMTNSEILSVSKILLESRAFSKDQMNSVLDKLIQGCVPYTNLRLVTELLANERHHYVALNHGEENPDKLWDLGNAVKNTTLLEIEYRRQQDGACGQKRTIEPVAIIFSEYYFYLIAYLVELDDRGTVANQKYDYPAVFRIDRIQSYHLLEHHFKIPYANRFEEGEFRKRVQFMYPGELMRIEFKYTGTSVEAVMDRLPTSKIIKEEDGVYIVQAEVYGHGIMMWLLSQGEVVEVLKPEKLRDKMKDKIKQMMDRYE